MTGNELKQLCCERRRGVVAMTKHPFPAGFLLCCLLASAPVAAFAEVAGPNLAMEASVKPVLTRVASLELPATAARLVTSAKSADKEATALAIVRVVAKLNPPALPSVVGAISKAQPSLAAKVADEAARLQPKLKIQISDAAQLKGTIANGPTLSNPTFVGAPSPATRPSEPQPTPGESKKNGHYKSPG